MTRDPLPSDAPRRLRRAEAVLARRMGRLAVVVEDLVDSHNIDAVVRTAEALGVQHLYRIERDTGDLVHPEITQGAHRWLTIERFTDAGDCIDAVRAAGYGVWAADVAPGARPLDELELPPRLAVVLGSEGMGLSPVVRERADERFYLPMVGFTGSLNVSVTAALVMWDLVRRFVRRDGFRGDLDEAQRERLRALWYRRLARTRSQRLLFPRYLDHPPPPADQDVPPPDRRTLGASAAGSDGNGGGADGAGGGAR